MQSLEHRAKKPRNICVVDSGCVQNICIFCEGVQMWFVSKIQDICRTKKRDVDLDKQTIKASMRTLFKVLKSMGYYCQDKKPK